MVEEGDLISDSKHPAWNDGSETENSHKSIEDSLTLREARNEIREVVELAFRETKNIRLWRLALILILIILGGAVSASTYAFLSHQDEADYLHKVS